MSKKAMKLALEALKNSVDSVSNEAREAESLYGKYPSRLARVQGLVALEVAHQTAIKALEEALAKQEQGEPEEGEWIEVSARWGKRFVEMPNPLLGNNYIARFYFEPQQRTWVGLTIEEREQIQQECFGKVPHHVAFAHAIEARLKDLNT